MILGVTDIDASNLYNYHSDFYNYNGRLTETGKSEKWAMPYISPNCHVSLEKETSFLRERRQIFSILWARAFQVGWQAVIQARNQ
jgi:hypothetical protein